MVATGSVIQEENNNNPFTASISKKNSTNSDSSLTSTLGLKKNSFDGKYKYWIDPSD